MSAKMADIEESSKMAAVESGDCGAPGGGVGVRDFYGGRSVLVTGATGFMGKVLVEKLLRTCDRIEKVFVLVRPKTGSDVKQRIREMVDAKVFSRLRSERPQAVSKLIPVCGDVTEASLGLSEEDERTLVQGVTVVFHLAATVRFDDPLKKALDINTLGTKRVIDLCRKMPGLKALVYVSTAYCHSQRRDIEEKFYPVFNEPLKVVEAIQCLDDSLVASLTPHLLGGRQNTYSLSKALAEQLLAEEAPRIPLAVVRPSMVIGSWKDPFPGWTEVLNGPSSFIAAYAKGILRCMHYNPKMRADFVPVDVADNMTIAAAWDLATRRPPVSGVIYNCTLSKESKMTWAEHEEFTVRTVSERPTKPIWHPSLLMFQSQFFFYLYFYLTLLFPGCLVDAIARFTGNKPVFVKLQKKVFNYSKAINFISFHEWNFRNDNVCALWDALDPKCQQDFFFDIRKIRWSEYFRDLYTGVKRFILKEEPQDEEANRGHAKKLHIVHRLCQILLAFLMFSLLSRCFPEIKVF